MALRRGETRMSSWPTTQRRRRGRHTSLIDGAEDDTDSMTRAFADWPPAGLTAVAATGAANTVRGQAPDGTGTGTRHEGGTRHETGTRDEGGTRPDRTSLVGGGTRVRIRGEGPAAGDDTVVLGDLGLFRRPVSGPRTGTFGGPGGRTPGIGIDRPVPPRPWYRQRWRLAAVTGGLTIVALAGFLGVPPLLNALGVGAQSPCPLCQFPIPSPGAIPPSSGQSPAVSSPAPRPSRPARTATASTSPPARVVAPQPPATRPSAPTLAVTYTAIPAGGGFTGQVTVTNRGTSAITNWHLVVALPGDSVSAVQNAEFTDDNDVLFMTPAPQDLSILPGTTVTVSIYASGPDRTPAACSFNQVACR